MLSPYRVLDLTNERGLLAGKMLADLGADVIQIEPPAGSRARQVAPFFAEERSPSERSIYWAAYAANKRGITLNLDSVAGQALLKRLVERTDFLFESEDPGVMAARGLAYQDLETVNPALIHTSITPFGPDGPKAGYAESDLVMWAAGGAMGPSREAGRPPVRISSVWQSYQHAAGDAAGAALVAHFERVRSGRGQHVDIAIQQSVAQATLSGILAAAVGEPPPAAQGATGSISKWPVKDGYIDLNLVSGSALGHFSNNLFRWVYSLGGCDAATAALDWRRMPELLADGRVTQEELGRIRLTVGEFLRTRSKQELLEAALEHKIMLSPVLTVADLAASPQLAAREFWQAMPGDPRGAVRYPGPFARLPDGSFQFVRPAPRPGQHNREVYGDALGLGDDELSRLAAEGVI